MENYICRFNNEYTSWGRKWRLARFKLHAYYLFKRKLNSYRSFEFDPSYLEIIKRSVNQPNFTFKNKINLNKNTHNLRIYRRMLLKGILQMTLMLAIWIAVFIMIQGISEKFGDNMFQLCVIPFISLLLTNLIISPNVMIVISSGILYLFGDILVKLKKHNIFYLVLKSLVPPACLLRYNFLTGYHKIKDLATLK